MTTGCRTQLIISSPTRCWWASAVTPVIGIAGCCAAGRSLMGREARRRRRRHHLWNEPARQHLLLGRRPNIVRITPPRCCSAELLLGGLRLDVVGGTQPLFCIFAHREMKDNAARSRRLRLLVSSRFLMPSSIFAALALPRLRICCRRRTGSAAAAAGTGRGLSI